MANNINRKITIDVDLKDLDTAAKLTAKIAEKEREIAKITAETAHNKLSAVQKANRAATLSSLRAEIRLLNQRATVVAKEQVIAQKAEERKRAEIQKTLSAYKSAEQSRKRYDSIGEKRHKQDRLIAGKWIEWPTEKWQRQLKSFRDDADSYRKRASDYEDLASRAAPDSAEYKAAMTGVRSARAKQGIAEKNADKTANKLIAAKVGMTLLEGAVDSAKQINSIFKQATGISFSIKDNFQDIANSVSSMLDTNSGVATYSAGTSLITNSAARTTQMKYGLTPSQAYGFTQASNLLNISSDEDLLYMNAGQRQLFSKYMEKQSSWYDRLESSGMLEQIQAAQLDLAMWKQEMAANFLVWFGEHKDQIMNAVEGLLSVVTSIANLLSSIFTLFGAEKVSLSSSASDIVAAQTTVSTNNSRSVNVTMKNNVNGVFNQSEMENFLNERLESAARSAAAALGG